MEFKDSSDIFKSGNLFMDNVWHLVTNTGREGVKKKTINSLRPK